MLIGYDFYDKTISKYSIVFIITFIYGFGGWRKI